MKGQGVLHIKERLQDGAIIEMVIWQLPESGDQGGHGVKYRLYSGTAGERLVGYDNERGNGDQLRLVDVFQLRGLCRRVAGAHNSASLTGFSGPIPAYQEPKLAL